MISAVEFIKRGVVCLTISYAIVGITVASAGAWFVHQSLAGDADLPASEIVPKRLVRMLVARQEKRKVYPY
jgi:hypothetical protein